MVLKQANGHLTSAGKDKVLALINNLNAKALYRK
jgi:hypothetical protein